MLFPRGTRGRRGVLAPPRLRAIGGVRWIVPGLRRDQSGAPLYGEWAGDVTPAWTRPLRRTVDGAINKPPARSNVVAGYMTGEIQTKRAINSASGLVRS